MFSFLFIGFGLGLSLVLGLEFGIDLGIVLAFGFVIVCVIDLVLALSVGRSRTLKAAAKCLFRWILNSKAVFCRALPVCSLTRPCSVLSGRSNGARQTCILQFPKHKKGPHPQERRPF